MVRVSIIDELLDGLDTDVALHDIRVGAFWTAVVVEKAGALRAGLASTLCAESHPHKRPPVWRAGSLLRHGAREVALLSRSKSSVEISIGMAAINALIEVDEDACTEINAADVIARQGAGKKVVVVGHFPFLPTIDALVDKLWVLEQHPQSTELPAKRAKDVVPLADVVAITGTTLMNGTFSGLIALCRPEAYVIVLGGSTPLTSRLFEHGVNALSGVVVRDVPAVLRAVSEGATFRQIPGKSLLTMEAPVQIVTG
jgi:uncharacterized protein (DUF4213/DUF364 family)